MFKSLFKPAPAGTEPRRQGDIARDQGDWPRAEAAYQAHLADTPDDAAIWVQYGHALKEQGKLGKAAAAYRTATVLRPNDADAELHRSNASLRAAQAGQDVDDDPPQGSAAVFGGPGGQPVALSEANLSGKPAALRQAADQARNQGDYAYAAALFRKLLAADPSSASLWLQRGHMLKELGLLVKAKESYVRAGELAPQNPEIQVQKAILAKMMGEFEDAVSLFKGSSALGYQDADFIERELQFLEDSRPKQRTTRFPDEKPPQIKVFFSSATKIRLSEARADVGTLLGLANYSYSFIIKGYADALERLGVGYEFIEYPEYIADIAALSDCPVSIHFGFYPPDGIRLLKGAFNVAVIAWEFERLPTTGEIASDHAFSDPAKMLALPDAIWSISGFGAEAVERATARSVQVVPTPVLTNVAEGPRSAIPAMRQLDVDEPQDRPR